MFSLILFYWIPVIYSEAVYEYESFKVPEFRDISDQRILKIEYPPRKFSLHINTTISNDGWFFQPSHNCNQTVLLTGNYDAFPRPELFTKNGQNITAVFFTTENTTNFYSYDFQYKLGTSLQSFTFETPTNTGCIVKKKFLHIKFSPLFWYHFVLGC